MNYSRDAQWFAGFIARVALACLVAAIVLLLAGCGVLGGVKQSIPPPTRGAYALVLGCDGVSVREILTAASPVETTADCERLVLRLEALEESSWDPQKIELDCDGELTVASLSPGVDLDLGAVQCPSLKVRMR